jgi:hypothetical protein
MAKENAFALIDEFRGYGDQMVALAKEMDVLMAAAADTNDADGIQAVLGTLNRLETTRASILERAEAVKERLERILGPV